MTYLSHDGAQTAVSEGILKTPQNSRLVATLEEDHAVERQSALGQGWREEVGLGKAPQHPPPGSRRYARSKSGCGCPVHGAIGPAGDLVKGATNQSPAGQFVIDLFDSERQDGSVGTASIAETGSKGTELGSIVSAHDMLTSFLEFTSMFFFCSNGR
jgi:hypothetical protein